MNGLLNESTNQLYNSAVEGLVGGQATIQLVFERKFRHFKELSQDKQVWRETPITNAMVLSNPVAENIQSRKPMADQSKVLRAKLNQLQPDNWQIETSFMMTGFQ